MGERPIPHVHVRPVADGWAFPVAADGGWDRRVVGGTVQVRWTCNWCGWQTPPVPHHLLGRAGVSTEAIA